MKTSRLIIMFLALATLVSCNKTQDKSDLDIVVDYQINEGLLLFDTLCYTNEAGNVFLITEIQWFLSNIELKNASGDWYTLHQLGLHDTLEISRIFYIDTNIPGSQSLHVQPIQAGNYTAVRFTFGLDEHDNWTGFFNNPPESNMFWPEPLGGGYHYMKLNGKYLDTEGNLSPLNVHLGIGQNEDLSQFYQNYFTVELPVDIDLKANTENRFNLTMIIDNWFRQPHTYDFNVWGGAIMQNQEAQRVLKINGSNVFKVFQNNETQTNNDIAMKKGAQIEKRFRAFMQKAAPKPHFWTLENVEATLEQIKESNKNRS